MGLFESQLEVRASFDEEMMNGAYAALANGIGPQGDRISGSESGSDPMSLAVAACLRCYGAEAGAVPEEADEGEKLHYLCRPSGTMHRDVRLEKGWYRQTFGPMLGSLDTGESVALLPRGFQGYVIFDPKTGTRTRVNAKTEARIAPKAVFFLPRAAVSCHRGSGTVGLHGAVPEQGGLPGSLPGGAGGDADRAAARVGQRAGVRNGHSRGAK